jgi:hypothetical protein
MLSGDGIMLFCLAFVPVVTGLFVLGLTLAWQ